MQGNKSVCALVHRMSVQRGALSARSWWTFTITRCPSQRVGKLAPTSWANSCSNQKGALQQARLHPKKWCKCVATCYIGMTTSIFYSRRRMDVMYSRSCLSICCLWAGYLKTLWMVSDETWWTGWVCDDNNKPIRFWFRSGCRCGLTGGYKTLTVQPGGSMSSTECRSSFLWNPRNIICSCEKRMAD